MRIALLCLTMLTVALGGNIVPELEGILANARPDEKVAVIAHTRVQADLARLTMDADYDAKISHLRSVAENAQRDIIAWLETTNAENIQSFWLSSKLALSATPDVVRALAARPDIDFVIDDFVVTLNTDTHPTTGPDLLEEWNISKISAPECWAEGYDGTGIVVGNIDTGVLVTHEAFGNRWRSQNGWFDGVNGRSTPYDDHDHGTHCMGIAVGGSGIGVAPGATFIAAKAFNSTGSAHDSWISACLDWMAGTGRPDVISNSWSSGRTSTGWFSAFSNLRNLGIVVVAGIGNSGSHSSTSQPPGSFPISIGVGATNSNDAIADFSSRGPAPNSNPWNNTSHWPRPDWDLTNPVISAPGVGIRSALRSGGYGNKSGTSMAAPHAAGAAALLLQRNRHLTHNEIFNLLTDHADQPAGGGTYPNNDYGWGRLNCKAALDNAGSSTAPELFLNRISIASDNGRLDPGETAGLIAYIRNISTVGATDLIGTLRVTDPYVSVTDSVVSFGDLPGRDSTSNLSDPFQVTASSSCPEGHTIRMSLFLACEETTATHTFELMIGVPNKWLMAHDTGYCHLTVSSHGTIGNDAPTGPGGGFRYPKTGLNALYHASLAIGNSDHYIVDRYYGRPAHGPENDDFRVLDSLRPVWPPEAGDQHYRTRYTDTGHPTPKGLRITQNSFMTAQAGYDHFIVLVFDIANTGAEAINDLYAGVFADFAIGTNFVENTAASDEARRFVFMRRASTDNPTVGVKLLAPNSFANLTAIDHALYVYPDSGLTESMKLRMLNGTISRRNSDRAYDWSTLNSVGPFDLPVGARYRYAVAFVGGTNVATALANADSAQSWYERSIGIAEKATRQNRPVPTFTILPNPFSGRTTVRLQIPQAGPVRVNILDVTGRRVATLIDAELPAGQRELTWQPGSIANGVYLIRAEIGSNTETRTVLLTR